MLTEAQQNEIRAYMDGMDGDSALFQCSALMEEKLELKNEITALKAELENCHQQDRLKTREINILTPENRALKAKLERVKEILALIPPRIAFQADEIDKALKELDL